LGAGNYEENVKNFETSVEPGDDRRFIPAPAPSGRPPRAPASSKGNPRLRLVAVLAFALLAGLVTWLVTTHTGKSSKSSNATIKVVSEQGLQKLVSSKPVYWAGPEQGARYAVEQRSNGQVYVRYVTAQMKADTVATLTVGTYPMKNAYASTVALGKKSGWKQLVTGTGGQAAFSSSAHPRNVYLAQPGLDYQIEIYDPTPGRAAVLVQAGRVLPVAQGERLGLTLTALKQKVASLGTPVYWIGSESHVTYEYTRNPNGNVYLRYLPRGVAVGASGAYPTIGTYPMAKAVATTKAAGGRPGAVRVKLSGAEAFYANSKPTSVYVAFTGSDFQIEVYNPVAAQALAAVKTGLLTLVS
jgi:hypothetical protein